jgi:predicted kinase
MILAIVGQEGVGKTTVASRLADNLRLAGHGTAHIDGELVRNIIGNGRYGHEWRATNAWATGGLARSFHERGFNVIVSAVFPTEAVRRIFLHACGGDIEWVQLDYAPYVSRKHGLTMFEALEDGDNVSKIFKPQEHGVLEIWLSERFSRRWLSVVKVS